MASISVAEEVRMEGESGGKTKKGHGQKKGKRDWHERRGGDGKSH
jgi:hypothetical protein